MTGGDHPVTSSNLPSLPVTSTPPPVASRHLLAPPYLPQGTGKIKCNPTLITPHMFAEHADVVKGLKYALGLGRLPSDRYVSLAFDVSTPPATASRVCV